MSADSQDSKRKKTESKKTDSKKTDSKKSETSSGVLLPSVTTPGSPPRTGEVDITDEEYREYLSKNGVGKGKVELLIRQKKAAEAVNTKIMYYNCTAKEAAVFIRGGVGKVQEPAWSQSYNYLKESAMQIDSEDEAQQPSAEKTFAEWGVQPVVTSGHATSSSASSSAVRQDIGKERGCSDEEGDSSSSEEYTEDNDLLKKMKEKTTKKKKTTSNVSPVANNNRNNKKTIASDTTTTTTSKTSGIRKSSTTSRQKTR